MKTLPTRTNGAAPKAADPFEPSAKKSVVIPEEMSGITDEDAFDLLDNAGNEQLSELTGSYWQPTPGTHTFKFLGMDTYEGDKGPQEAVKLQDREGLQYIAAQAVLVNSLKKVTELPCFCKVIVADQKIKGRNGDYYAMKVLTFPAAANQKL